MKVSLKVAQYYSNVDINSVGAEEILRLIGAQLGAVEDAEYFGPRYDNIIVARVVSCIKHPDADKLSVCKIDDGGLTQNVERDEDDNVQVVCGAPNVRAGLTVAWLPPGVTVPSTITKDPFVLEVREIRGQVSNGMLASPAELDISDNHEGILEIDIKEVGEELIKPGTSFKQLYGLDDVIIDCENKMFTHRPDCFGILGVARELAGIQGLAFQSPDWYTKSTECQVPSTKLPLEVRVEDDKLVPRFMAAAMSGIKVAPSPIWMQAFLTRVGIKPINNIVDITNYFSQLTGQPTHAYDYDKVAKLSGHVPVLIARQAKNGDKIALLNGKTVEFDAPSVVIATDRQAIGVGGIMGGIETEVDENTKNIILECANFDMYNIRRTSMKYGLFTDAVTRFTKGQSIYQNDRILAKIIYDISEQYGGEIASKMFDVRGDLPLMNKVNVSVGFINDRLGSSLSAKEIKQLLENVEFIVEAENDNLLVDYPFWRTDIELPEDVVEEVGRLYGFDKLPVELPKRDLTPVKKNPVVDLKNEIRSVLSSCGANEVLTYSFVHGNLIDKVGQDKDFAFKLSNALSPDLQYYRLSLVPSLLDKVHSNIKSGHNEFALFEIGKSHCNDFMDKDGLPIEEQRLAFVFATDDKTAKSKYSGLPYYQARKYLDYILAELGIAAVFEPAADYEPKLNVSKQAFAPFEPKRTALIKTKNGEFLGEIGEFRSKVRKNLKLPNFVAGFELDIKQLMKLRRPKVYSPLSRFPSSEQDLSVKVNSTVNYEDVFGVVSSVSEKAEKMHGYIITISPVDIYQSEDKSQKHITLRVKVTHHDRTLVTEEVNSLMQEIASSAEESLGAVRL